MPDDSILIALTLIAIIVSAVIDRRKTLMGLRRGGKMLLNLLPQFLMLLVIVSVLLTFVPREPIVSGLGKQSGGLGVIVAAGIGSVALVPGPIVYPLAGMLVENGMSWTVISVFITTLMMVGILTFPVEKAYLGLRLAALRNILFFFGALIIGVLVGSVL